MSPENNRAKHVLKICLPTSVGVRPVLIAVVARKQKKVAPNVLIVVLGKQVLGMTVVVTIVRRVNFVPPMVIKPILVRLVVQDIINKNGGKLPVCPAFLGCTNRSKAVKNVFLVLRGSTKICPMQKSANLLLRMRWWLVVVPHPSQYRWGLSKQIAATTMKKRVKNLNNAPRVGWETIHPR